MACVACRGWGGGAAAGCCERVRSAPGGYDARAEQPAHSASAPDLPAAPVPPARHTGAIAGPMRRAVLAPGRRLPAVCGCATINSSLLCMKPRLLAAAAPPVRHPRACAKPNSTAALAPGYGMPATHSSTLSASAVLWYGQRSVGPAASYMGALLCRSGGVGPAQPAACAPV